MDKKRFWLIVPMLVFLFFGGFEKASACTCLDSASICEHYSDSDAVIKGKIEQIQIFNDSQVFSNAASQKVKVKIEKSFKGIDSEFVVLAQPNTSCDWQFKETDKGKTFLFYLDKNENANDYSIKICGRSSAVEGAQDDLRWLEGLPKSLERTRFSGTVSYYEKNPNFRLIDYLTGVKVKIFNDEKSFEAVSDKSGVYEFWDLPAGKYKVKTEFPKGYVSYFDFTHGKVDNKKAESEKDNSFDYTLDVTPKSCAGIDYIMNKIN